MASNEQRIWNYLKSKGLNDFGVAGLMGNLYAESALNPKNLQQTFEKKLGYTDANKNGNPIRVNGISGSDNDHRAITIEVASDTTHPYAVTDAAYEGLIRLLVDICKRNPGIRRLRWLGDKSLVGETDKQNMTVHRWFAYKSCPGDYLYERHSAIAEEVNRRLDAEILETEDDDMDAAKFKEMWLEMRKELQDNDAGQWSEAARAWAISNGLINGNGSTVDGEPNCMWADVLTREQFITVLYRFAQIMGKA